jgi:TatD DNase family protein
MEILKDVNVPIIIHCFTGTKEQCVEYVKRGYYISLSGYILKEANDNCAEVLACLKEGIIPLDKLMIETDAPYMGFPDCRQLYMEHNADYYLA